MFTHDQISTEDERDEDGAGIVMGDIGRAVMIWASMNYGRPLSVAECATVFNTSVDIIRQAVTEDVWAFLSPERESDPAKQLIDIDGE